mmetsp:Transcript_73304/g.177306  ORF Transcript_73304/g.177306 Transcript_73304/m.177306 type:complete len:548 (+) Transcript_73304:193-1836(+)
MATMRDTDRSTGIKEQAAEKIRKQRATIEKVKQENQVLAHELNLESRQTRMTTNEFAKREVARVRAEGDAYVRRIEVEKRKIVDLETALGAMQGKIFEQRHRTGGLNATRDNSKMIAKQIQILENRLDKALVRYNGVLGRNKELRSRIDELRRERVVFDGIYKKLEREIHERTRQLKELADQANNAYRTRDSVQADMAALKVRAERDSDNFEREWKAMSKAIEDDRRAHEATLEAGEESSGPTGEGGKRGDLTIEQERELKRKVAQGAWLIGKDKASIAVSADKVASYEEAFAKIQMATGITDIDSLVDKFIEAEDKNYSLFNYVNQLATEIEKLEGAVSDVHSEIERYKGQGAQSDNQRKRILRELQDRLEKTKNKAESFDSKYQGSMNHINLLKSAIQSIFVKIGCHTPSVAELLGAQGVTETNMMQYLGIVEQRINELLHAYAKTMRGDDAALARTGGKKLTLRAPSDMFEEPTFVKPKEKGGHKHMLKVAPPDWDDISSDEDSDDEDTRPLTLEELHRTPLRFRARPTHKGVSKSTTVKGKRR